MADRLKAHRKIIRVAGRLREIVTVKDEKGKILHRVMKPIMLEFYFRDVVQIVVGASILTFPVAFTEEVWNLGQTLPLFNVFFILFLSLLFISIFVYYNYYRGELKNHYDEFIKRVLSTYIVSLFVVAIFLTAIQRAPWSVDWMLALKRTIIVTSPASMSAAIADMIK